MAGSVDPAEEGEGVNGSTGVVRLREPSPTISKKKV